MNNYLLDLLQRMDDRSDAMIDLPDGGRRSNPEASFLKAYDEAKQLQSLEYVEPLKTFIGKTKSEELKQNAYSVLMYLYANTKDSTIVSYCIDQLATEKKEWTLHSILWNIECLKNKIPASTNIDPILALTTHKKHIVRDGAIKCLVNADNPTAEEQLIRIISTGTDPFQLTYANATLRKIGSAKSIPHLVKLVDHKKQDVAGTALSAIIQLSDKSYLPLFIKHLEKGKLKYLGLEGVIKYGDQQVIPLVEKRVRELVAKQRTGHFILSKNETEVTVAMHFLANYAQETATIRKLYDTLTTTKWDFLWDEEKQWLLANKQRFE